MVTMIAHGPTAFNKPNPDKVLGWSDPSLTEEGHRGSEKLAKELAKMRGQVASIKSSDMRRATETAKPVAKALGLDVDVMPELRPWKLGQFQGHLSKEVDPQIEHYKQDGNATPPGGESYNTFKQRLLSVMPSLIESKDHHLVFTHSRDLDEVRTFAEAKWRGRHEGPEKGDETKPFDRYTIHPDYSISDVVGEKGR